MDTLTIMETSVIYCDCKRKFEDFSLALPQYKYIALNKEKECKKNADEDGRYK